jgi:hypothetical protein
MKQQIGILIATVFATTLFGCSQSSKGGGDDTSTDIMADTTSDTTIATDVITDSNSSSETMTDSDTGSGQISDSDSFSDTASDTQTEWGTESGIDTNIVLDSDTSSDADTDTAIDNGTESGTEINIDTDSDTLNTDTGSDGDPDTGGTIYKDCPLSGTIGCEGKDVWCFIGDTPGDFVASCPGSLFCEEIGEGVAQCKCKPDYYQKCEDDEIWSYDSCGNRLSLVTTCTGDEHCVERSDRSAECTVCDDYWGGENCDECLGFNGGDTDHCQCPAPGYHPVAGTNTCLTDLLPCTANADGCGARINTMIWEEAVRRCPHGFRLPTMKEINQYVFDNTGATDDGSTYYFASCEYVSCSEWSPDIFNIKLWTAQICEDGSGHMSLGLSAFAGSDRGIIQCPVYGDNTSGTGAICIKK